MAAGDIGTSGAGAAARDPLSRKIGGVPLWVIGVAGAGLIAGIYFWRKSKSSSAGGAQPATAATAAANTAAASQAAQQQATLQALEEQQLGSTQQGAQNSANIVSALPAL
jgi:hypothetical protein